MGSGYFSGDRAELGSKLEYPVVLYTEAWDSIISTNASNHILGQYTDPIFGGVKSSISARVLMSKLDPDFGAGAVCDSVKLKLSYRGYYGDTTGPFNLRVSVLQDPIDTLIYYSNVQFPLSDVLVDTSLQMNMRSWNYNGVDSLRGVLMADLNTSYFQQMLFQASEDGESYLETNDEFIKEVAGLHFETTSMGNGLAYFDMTASKSTIDLYYHVGEGDTIPKVYTLTFGQNLGDPLRFVSHYSHDYTTAAFDTAMQDTLLGGVNAYTQGVAGARTVISLAGLDTLVGKGYSINRAELVIPVHQGTAYPYSLPPMMLLKEDHDTAFYTVYNNINSSITGVGGNAIKSEYREFKYTFNVTSLIHKYVNTDYGIQRLIVTPSASSSNAYRAVLNGGIHPSEPAQFYLYYTRSN